MTDVDVEKDTVAVLVLLFDQIIEIRADWNHRLRQSGLNVPGIHCEVESGDTGVSQLVDYLRPHQPSVGRQIDPEVFLRRVVDDLVGEVGAQKRLAAHQRQHTALNQQVPNPFQGLLPGTSLNSATVTQQQLLLPFPEFTGLSEQNIPVGKVWYNPDEHTSELQSLRHLVCR